MDSKELTRLARGVERAQHLTADQRVHLWMLTINNPQKNTDAFTAWLNGTPDASYTLPGACSPLGGASRDAGGPHYDMGIATHLALRREDVDRGEAESYVHWALDRFSCMGPALASHAGRWPALKSARTARSTCTWRRVSPDVTAAPPARSSNCSPLRTSRSPAVVWTMWSSGLEKSGKWADTEKADTTIVPPIAMGAALISNQDAASSGREGKPSKRDQRWRTLFDLMTAHDKTVADLLTDPETAVMAKDLLPALDRLEATIRDRRPHTRDVRFICVTVRNERLLPAVRAEVRRYLDSKGDWGKWDFDLAVQPSVRADTWTLLIDRPRPEALRSITRTSSSRAHRCGCRRDTDGASGPRGRRWSSSARTCPSSSNRFTPVRCSSGKPTNPVASPAGSTPWTNTATAQCPCRKSRLPSTPSTSEPSPSAACKTTATEVKPDGDHPRYDDDGRDHGGPPHVASID